VKCKRCGAPAVIEVRRHNSAYCKDCFLDVFGGQVERAIEKWGMVSAGDRILVAVSGGKDSLALWDVLLRAGYAADGLYLGLGIGEYSDRSAAVTAAFAESHGAALRVVDLAEDFGFDIPTAGRKGSRSTCAVCGLSKRYVFNKVALDGGYDVVATGHNLDDEAATLLGNTMRWQTDAIARQSPVLPSKDGMVKKVKPLFRLSELETAAYAFLRGIDYVVEECPLVAGNTQLRYKDAMNAIESRSPGTKAQFLFGYLERGRPLFRTADDATLTTCEACGQPTTARFCAFCRAQAQILGNRLGAPSSGRDDAPTGDRGLPRESLRKAEERQTAEELSDEVLPVDLYGAEVR
jgi:tRNA-5-methyluridine54 2-sulfurtransferase